MTRWLESSSLRSIVPPDYMWLCDYDYVIICGRRTLRRAATVSFRKRFNQLINQWTQPCVGQTFVHQSPWVDYHTRVTLCDFSPNVADHQDPSSLPDWSQDDWSHYHWGLERLNRPNWLPSRPLGGWEAGEVAWIEAGTKGWLINWLIDRLIDGHSLV